MSRGKAWNDPLRALFDIWGSEPWKPPLFPVVPFLVCSHKVLGFFPFSEDFQSTQPPWKSIAPKRRSFCRFWPRSISYPSCSSFSFEVKPKLLKFVSALEVEELSDPEEGLGLVGTLHLQFPVQDNTMGSFWSQDLSLTTGDPLLSPPNQSPLPRGCSLLLWVQFSETILCQPGILRSILNLPFKRKNLQISSF